MITDFHVVMQVLPTQKQKIYKQRPNALISILKQKTCKVYTTTGIQHYFNQYMEV